MKELLKESVLQIKEILFFNQNISSLKRCQKSVFFSLATLIIIVCRFVSVWNMPDVFCDEQDILDHMTSILTTGYDMQENYLPLFPQVGVGLTTYVYLYPMMFFLSFFGVTPIRARVVQQILTILACFLIAYGTKIWSGNVKMFWITLITALTLPWGFVQTNKIWDPSFVPVYFGIYFFFFSLLMKKHTMRKVTVYVYAIIVSISLVVLATVYPPVRIPAVAMWIYSFIWALKAKRIKIEHIMVAIAVAFLTSLPLLINLLEPNFNERSLTLFIFSQDLTLSQQIHQIFKSFGELFNPSFLFFGGDIIYRHSLPVFGMLGTISIIPIFVFLRKQEWNSIVRYMLFVIIMTYFSVALTYDYQPHGLRSCLAWPVFSILISHGWLKISEYEQGKYNLLWIVLFSVHFLCYFVSYLLIQHGIITLYA